MCVAVGVTGNGSLDGMLGLPVLGLRADGEATGGTETVCDIGLPGLDGRIGFLVTGLSEDGIDVDNLVCFDVESPAI